MTEFIDKQPDMIRFIGKNYMKRTLIVAGLCALACMTSYGQTAGTSTAPDAVRGKLKNAVNKNQSGTQILANIIAMSDKTPLEMYPVGYLDTLVELGDAPLRSLTTGKAGANGLDPSGPYDDGGGNNSLLRTTWVDDGTDPNVPMFTVKGLLDPLGQRPALFYLMDTNGVVYNVPDGWHYTNEVAINPGEFVVCRTSNWGVTNTVPWTNFVLTMRGLTGAGVTNYSYGMMETGCVYSVFQLRTTNAPGFLAYTNGVLYPVYPLGPFTSTNKPSWWPPQWPWIDEPSKRPWRWNDHLPPPLPPILQRSNRQSINYHHTDQSGHPVFAISQTLSSTPGSQVQVQTAGSLGGAGSGWTVDQTANIDVTGQATVTIYTVNSSTGGSGSSLDHPVFIRSSRLLP